MIGLFFKCPLNECTEGCPYENLRKSHSETRQLIKTSLSLNEDVLNNYYKYHQNCMNKRLIENMGEPKRIEENNTKSNSE
jgi:hypothetical protein